MNFLHLLTSRAGKAAPSVQAAGLAVAVGVVGVAAWQMLSSPSEVNPDTVFSAADNDVVFVAGAPGGSGYGANYVSGNGYNEGGAVRSGIQTRLSHDMRLMQEDHQRNAPGADAPVTVSDRQVQAVERYDMKGSSEGLGLGQNAMQGGSMPLTLDAAGAGISMPNMGDLQQKIAQAQAQAEAEAAQKTQADIEAAQEKLAATMNATKASMADPMNGGAGRWGMASGIARANGNNLNSAPLQPGMEGESLQGGNAPDGAGRVSGIDDPKRLAPGRSAMFEGGRDAQIGMGKNLHRGDALDSMQKMSAEIAGNAGKNSANEMTRVFMSGHKLSGGIQVDGYSSSSAGRSVKSTDVKGLGNKLKNLTEAADQIAAAAQAEAEAYQAARDRLKTKIGIFITAGAVLLGLSWLRWTLFGYCVLLAAYAAYMASYAIIVNEINEFEDEWYDNPDKIGNYKGDGYADKVRDMASAATFGAFMAVFASVLAASVWFAVTIPAMYFSNYASSQPTEEQPQNGQQDGGQSGPVVSESPYGGNATDDALNLNEGGFKPTK